MQPHHFQGRHAQTSAWTDAQVSLLPQGIDPFRYKEDTLLVLRDLDEKFK